MDTLELLQEEQKPVGNGKELPVRYDGRLKVLGKAKYASEFGDEFKGKGMLYAYLIVSSIASGEIVSMDTTAADRAAGVVKILTPFNAPKLPIVAPATSSNTQAVVAAGSHGLLQQRAHWRGDCKVAG